MWKEMSLRIVSHENQSSRQQISNDKKNHMLLPIYSCYPPFGHGQIDRHPLKLQQIGLQAGNILIRAPTCKGNARHHRAWGRYQHDNNLALNAPIPGTSTRWPRLAAYKECTCAQSENLSIQRRPSPLPLWALTIDGWLDSCFEEIAWSLPLWQINRNTMLKLYVKKVAK